MGQSADTTLLGNSLCLNSLDVLGKVREWQGVRIKLGVGRCLKYR